MWLLYILLSLTAIQYGYCAGTFTVTGLSTTGTNDVSNALPIVMKIETKNVPDSWTIYCNTSLVGWDGQDVELTEVSVPNIYTASTTFEGPYDVEFDMWLWDTEGNEAGPFKMVSHVGPELYLHSLVKKPSKEKAVFKLRSIPDYMKKMDLEMYCYHDNEWFFMEKKGKSKYVLPPLYKFDPSWGIYCMAMNNGLVVTFVEFYWSVSAVDTTTMYDGDAYVALHYGTEWKFHWKSSVYAPTVWKPKVKLGSLNSARLSMQMSNAMHSYIQPKYAHNCMTKDCLIRVPLEGSGELTHAFRGCLFRPALKPAKITRDTVTETHWLLLPWSKFEKELFDVRDVTVTSGQVPAIKVTFKRAGINGVKIIASWERNDAVVVSYTLKYGYDNDYDHGYCDLKHYPLVVEEERIVVESYYDEFTGSDVVTDLAYRTTSYEFDRAVQGDVLFTSNASRAIVGRSTAFFRNSPNSLDTWNGTAWIARTMGSVPVMKTRRIQIDKDRLLRIVFPDDLPMTDGPYIQFGLEYANGKRLTNKDAKNILIQVDSVAVSDPNYFPKSKMWQIPVNNAWNGVVVTVLRKGIHYVTSAEVYRYFETRPFAVIKKIELWDSWTSWSSGLADPPKPLFRVEFQFCEVPVSLYGSVDDPVCLEVHPDELTVEFDSGWEPEECTVTKAEGSDIHVLACNGTGTWNLNIYFLNGTSLIPHNFNGEIPVFDVDSYPIRNPFNHLEFTSVSYGMGGSLYYSDVEVSYKIGDENIQFFRSQEDALTDGAGINYDDTVRMAYPPTPSKLWDGTINFRVMTGDSYEIETIVHADYETWYIVTDPPNIRPGLSTKVSVHLSAYPVERLTIATGETLRYHVVWEDGTRDAEAPFTKASSGFYTNTIQLTPPASGVTYGTVFVNGYEYGEIDFRVEVSTGATVDRIIPLGLYNSKKKGREGFGAIMDLKNYDTDGDLVSASIRGGMASLSSNPTGADMVEWQDGQQGVWSELVDVGLTVLGLDEYQKGQKEIYVKFQGDPVKVDFDDIRIDSKGRGLYTDLPVLDRNAWIGIGVACFVVVVIIVVVVVFCCCCKGKKGKSGGKSKEKKGKKEKKEEKEESAPQPQPEENEPSKHESEKEKSSSSSSSSSSSTTKSHAD